MGRGQMAPRRATARQSAISAIRPFPTRRRPDDLSTSPPVSSEASALRTAETLMPARAATLSVAKRIPRSRRTSSTVFVVMPYQ